MDEFKEKRLIVIWDWMDFSICQIKRICFVVAQENEKMEIKNDSADTIQYSFPFFVYSNSTTPIQQIAQKDKKISFLLYAICDTIERNKNEIPEFLHS